MVKDWFYGNVNFYRCANCDVEEGEVMLSGGLIESIPVHFLFVNHEIGIGWFEGFAWRMPVV